jgi:hypothetical protein
MLLERRRKAAHAHFQRLKLLKLTARYNSKLPDTDDDVDFNRLDDLTDFDYRYAFRDELSATVRRRMEVAAAKLEYVNRSGEPGYFATLVKSKIDWKSEISVVASILQDWVEPVVHCCVGTKGGHGKPRNSGRCHEQDHCRCCNWMDFGFKLQSSLGEHSGTFESGIRNGLAWYAIHISVRRPRAKRSCRRPRHRS